MTATILAGGRIYAPPRRDVSAVVVIGDVISYVGDLAGARGFASGATEVDLDGRLVTPAFVDAHLHAVQTGQLLNGLDLHDATSREEVLEAVARFARQHPDRPVISGQGWDERHWPDPRPPTRAELDRAADGRAVYLARVDVHSAVVSSALLDRLSGVQDAVGYRPDGLLSGSAHHLGRGAMNRMFSDADRRADATAALRETAAHGIAQVHELGGPQLGPIEDLGRVRDVAADIGLSVRIYWGERANTESIAAARAYGAVGLAGDLCIDGALGSRTAALVDPYADEPGTAWRGQRYLDDDQIADHLRACTLAGVQAGFHCIGDDAVAAAIAGLRRVAAELRPAIVRRCRHRLEHLEMAAEADFPTLAELGVVASMQPGFDAAWGGPGELYEQRLGSDRSGAMNRLGSLHRSGVALAFGSDSPVIPLGGWEAVRAAVRHSQPAERLDVASAFVAATLGGQRAGLTEDSGLLQPGWRADLAVWDVDGVELDPMNGLPSCGGDDPLPACWVTMAAGRQIHGPADSGLPAHRTAADQPSE
jgi:predicted amidohydrolase YtcJ